MAGGESPDWVRDGLRQARAELHAFLRTAVRFTVAPRRFAREWASGEGHALNPLGFLATSLAATSFVLVVTGRLFASSGSGPSDAPTLWSQLLASLGPFAYYLLFGVIEHFTLWLFGLRHPLRDTCAMVLYAGGGPAALATLIAFAGCLPLYSAHPSEASKMLALVVLSVAYGGFIGLLSTALAGLHQGRLGFHHRVVANLVAMVVSGFIMGFNPPGEYGLHFVWALHHQAGAWHVSFSLTF